MAIRLTSVILWKGTFQAKNDTEFAKVDTRNIELLSWVLPDSMTRWRSPQNQPSETSEDEII